MKTFKTLLISLIACASSCFAGTITGTMQQVVGGQTGPAQGSVSVGIVAAGQGERLDAMKSLFEASAAKRIAQTGNDGSVSLENIPEEVPLYVSVFLRSGYGKFLRVTLGPGQVLDISQVVPDAKAGGMKFSGKIVWPDGITFQDKTSSMVHLSGKNNNWEYVSVVGDGGRLEVEDVQPGIYRLGIQSILANGVDRYDEVEVTVATGMEDPLLIKIP